MSNFTPFNKLSKRKKKELNARKRKIWGINPITRKPENPKAYNRSKVKRGNSLDMYPIV